MFNDYVEEVLREWTAAVTVAQTGTVAAAARQTGLSRHTLENILWAIEVGGAGSLRARAEHAVRRCPRYAASVRREAARLACLNPTWGRKRIARALTSCGFPTSSSRVRRTLSLQR